ncbi:Protein ALKAL-like [Dissostichus eleginoides]|uniref:Protein ALKAL-like n=1 Tax=Dissostichus eleginoides TaxID=100907 RepID=A0AAD9CAA0_DISEL|nr:Protein ALKAL-like [Dissostichus eleginoides]
MQVERKWHILFTIFFLLITSGQCMDSKVVKQKERRTLLDLILQVIRESQQRDKTVSRRCSSGLFTSAQDMKSTSREKPFYVPRLDNSRLIEIVPRDVNMKGKFIQHFTGPNIMEEGSLCCQGSAFKSTAVI